MSPTSVVTLVTDFCGWYRVLAWELNSIRAGPRSGTC
jgi:hypothetical protein